MMVGQDSKVVPSPATGQVHSMEIPPPSPQQEDTDGTIVCVYGVVV